MNTDNKIVVSSSPRTLKKQFSNGVEDVHKPEHFPALPNAILPGASQRKLNRMSSSFKDMVNRQQESEVLPAVSEASVASSSSSPRIGARYQESAPEQTPAQSHQQNLPSIQAVVQQAPPVADADGFVYPRQRSSRSPQRTREDDLPSVSSPPPSTLPVVPADSHAPFGIPGHTNPFAILADGYVKSGASTPWCKTPRTLSDDEEVISSMHYEELTPFAHYPELFDDEADYVHYQEEPRSRGAGVGGKFSSLIHGVGGFIKAHPKTTVMVSVVAVTAFKLLLSRRRRC